MDRHFGQLYILTLLALALPTLPSVPFAAQETCRTFSGTGKTVCQQFPKYWDGHGGLKQQGYPISEQMQEVSETDGKTYTVQYFERAVFEYHPEKAGTEYKVLLSQLGKFRYDGKYALSNPECVGIPDGKGMTIEPNCFHMDYGHPPPMTPNHIGARASGFQSDERVNMYLLGIDLGVTCGPRYYLVGVSVFILDGGTALQYLSPIVFRNRRPTGIYEVTFIGERSQHRASRYFKVTAH